MELGTARDAAVASAQAAADAERARAAAEAAAAAASAELAAVTQQLVHVKMDLATARELEVGGRAFGLCINSCAGQPSSWCTLGQLSATVRLVPGRGGDAG